MSHDVILPQAGIAAAEGVLLDQLVAQGEWVEEGAVLATVETDKSVTEVEATGAGYVDWVVQAGDTVRGGGVVARLHEAQVAAGDGASSPAPVDAPAASHASPAGNGGPPDWMRVRASMSARAQARRAGVDLGALTGTGPGGRIVAADVVRAPAPAQPATPARVDSPGDVELVPLTGRRAAIARHLEAARNGAVPLTQIRFCDCNGLLGTVERLRDRHPGQPPSMTIVAARLVAAVLRRHPQVNARVTDEGVQRHRRVHLGIAVDTEEGLVVPVLRDADTLSLEEFSARFRELVEAARQRRLRSEDMDGGTFTITNVGPYGIDAGTPVLNWPQVGILSLGRVRREGGKATIGLSITVDHRVIDGVPSARFLGDVADAFAHPEAAFL